MKEQAKMVQIAYNALDEKKGEDIKIIDISGVSVIADYFVIANGNNILKMPLRESITASTLGR